MTDIFKTIESWSKEGRRLVLARVIETWGSSPRPVGSVMVICDDGRIDGSVSGGCIEGDVVKKAMPLMDTNSQKLLRYSVTNEDAWSVGLTCGGNVTVLLQSIDVNNDPVWQSLFSQLKANKACLLITGLDTNTSIQTIISKDGDATGTKLLSELINDARKCFQNRKHQIMALGENNYFLQVFPPKLRLIIIGAGHVSIELNFLAQRMDFETIIIEPRTFFAKNMEVDQAPNKLYELYPSEILDTIEPDEYTYCAILSHDPKIDDDALMILINLNVAYIGALGSKKSHEKRIQRLREMGIEDKNLIKIKAPIGLPIFAKTAQEIALAIMAEIIEAKNK